MNQLENRLGSFFSLQFIVNRFGYNDNAKQVRKDRNESGTRQVIDRSRVGNNDHGKSSASSFLSRSASSTG